MKDALETTVTLLLMIKLLKQYSILSSNVLNQGIFQKTKTG